VIENVSFRGEIKKSSIIFIFVDNQSILARALPNKAKYIYQQNRTKKNQEAKKCYLFLTGALIYQIRFFLPVLKQKRSRLIDLFCFSRSY